MMSIQNRREGYWKSYHRSHARELDFLIASIIGLIGENPHPRSSRGNGRGRPIIHDLNKMHCICILMAALDFTSRDMENLLAHLRLPPWEGQKIPDHTTIARAFSGISKKWLETILARTSLLCMKETNIDAGALLAADSTGIETDRYDYRTEKDKNSNSCML